MIFFHANAEDLGGINEILIQLKQALRINILAMEYPGYGIYSKVYKSEPGKREMNEVPDCAVLPSCEQIMNDAESVYNFALANF